MFPRIPNINFDPDEDAPDNPWSKWGKGVAFPVVAALYGISCIISRQATLIGRRAGRMPLAGWDAVALGTVALCVALYMHSHYFWSNTERLAGVAPLGKVVGMIAGILGLGFIIVRTLNLT